MLNNDVKKELKRIIDSELKQYKDDEQKRWLKFYKNDDQVRKYIVDIIRDSISDLFKTLYMKRSNWDKEIGRK